jgi:hypothetical protein
MSMALEVDQSGILAVPSTLLPNNEPRARYVVTVHGKQIVLEPESTEQPMWKSASTVEWLAGFRNWVSTPHNRDGQGLPENALTRDSIYD